MFNFTKVDATLNRLKTKFNQLKINEFKWISVSINIILIITIMHLYTDIMNIKQQTKEDIDTLTETLDYYQCNVDSLSNLVTYKHTVKTKVSKQTQKSPQKIKESTILQFDSFKWYNSVDVYLHKSMCKALDQYSGPDNILITSMRRKWCKHSKHFTGEAVDIQLNQSGRNMFEWMISEDGKLWLTDHNLFFYIEDKPGSSKLKEFRERFSEYIFENKNATGLHIHLARL